MLDTLDRKLICENSTLFLGDTRMPSTAVKSDAKIKTKSFKGSLSQGKTKSFKVTVSSGVTILDVDLKWTNKDNKLSLTAVSPSGKTYEPKYDKSDGKEDGEITFRVKANDGKDIEIKNWTFKVFGKSIKESENFALKSIAHLK